MRRLWSQKTLFFIHGVLGIKLAILMAVICLSGAIATVSHEIDWLLNPAIRIEPRADKPAGWGALHEAVRRAHPDWHVWWLKAPLYPSFAAEVVATPPSGQMRRLYVDPYTAVVQGETTFFNVQRFFRSFHMGLFLPRVGIYVVSFFGFVLLGSLVTGLLVYKKFWRGFFRWRMGKGARIFWGDAHKLMGVWSIPFTAIIALTGIWYFVEMAMYDADRSLEGPDPKIAQEVLAAYGPIPPERQPLDALVRRARAAFPELDIRSIYMPADPRDAIRFDGQTGAILVRDRANRVYLNPYSGAVMQVQRAEELGLARRWVDTADELHFGTFGNLGGLATKLLWLVFGLLLTGMVLSGSWLWLRRAVRVPARRRPRPVGMAPLERAG